MLIPLGHRQDAPNSAPLDPFLYIPSRLLVFVQKDVNLIRAAKEIVKVAHDVLISAHQKKSEVVRFTQPDAVQWQGFPYILQINELTYLAVGIACDISKGSVAVGGLIQLMNRHDGKKLSQRPMVQKGLKNRKIT